MQITFFGVRGTRPVTRPDSLKYGGETTSVLVEGSGGEKIALDAGTGIGKLGEYLEKRGGPKRLLVLMTHYHLDHLMGLPSFLPLYQAGWDITFAAPRRQRRSIGRVLPRILDQPFWPLQIENLSARIDFLNLPGPEAARPLAFGELEIRWAPLHHPGGCSAYRIDGPSSASFVFATDVEWANSSPREKEAFRRLCRNPAPPRLLAFDGQFEAANYRKFRDWGHGTWQTAVEVAREVRAGRLLIIHHSPGKNDRRLDEIDKKLNRILPEGRLAREGMSLKIN